MRVVRNGSDGGFALWRQAPARKRYRTETTPIVVPITSPEMTSSTRRFSWRPFAESLDATGWLSPKPLEVTDPDGNILRFGSDPIPGQPCGPWLDMHGVSWQL